MPVLSTAELVGRAHAGRSAALAFNVITLEHAEAIARAAEDTGVPAILQVSQNAVRYHGAVEPLAAGIAALARTSAAEIALHLDHVEDPALLHRAGQAGFSSAMFDAAALGYADNVEATRTAASWAHEHGLWLEAELGFVGGKPDSPVNAHEPGARTDPDEAVRFVEATGVDALAVAVGSTHAMTERTATIDLGLVEALRAVVAVPLVLHGSSGVPDDQLRAAVSAGITKINVGTALNVAFTAAVRESLGRPASVDPRHYLRAGREAMALVAGHLLSTLATPTG